MFYDNFLKACNLRGISPSAALTAAGIDKSAGTRWKNGKQPTPATLQKLADYFGISKSDLTGETYLKVTTGEVCPARGDDLAQLSAALDQLNDEGREKLLDYAADLVASGRYKKARPAVLGQA